MSHILIISLQGSMTPIIEGWAMSCFTSRFDRLGTMNAVSIDWIHSIHPCVMLNIITGHETQYKKGSILLLKCVLASLRIHCTPVLLHRMGLIFWRHKNLN